MIRRPTWILLAIFVVFAGAAIFMQKSNISLVKPSPTPTSSPKLLSEGSLDTLMSIDIKGSQAAPFMLKKGTDDQWKFVSLEGKPVDQGKIQEFISAVSNLSVYNSFEQSLPMDMTGLDPASYTLTLTMADGSTQILNIGKVTATNSGYYVRLNDGPTVVVNQYSIQDIINMLQPVNFEVPTPTIPPTETPAQSGTATAEPAGESSVTPTP